MTTREAGWYDDPQDGNSLRYWDGVEWTQHTSPKQKTGLEQAGTGGVGGAQAQGEGQPGQYAGQQPGQTGAPGQQPGQYGAPGQQPRQYGQAPQYGTHQDQYQYGQQQGGWGQPMPGGGYTGTVTGPATPDGQPLAGWGMRLLARIIDYIVVVVVLALLLPVIAPDFTQNYTHFLTNPSSTMPEGLTTDLLKVSLAVAILGFLYETVMLKQFGATLGKLITGLRVRLRDQPGPLSWGAAAIRAVVWHGPNLLGMVPVLSYVTFIFSILNGLWPLWDKNKQSINDKVAKSNVVRKRARRAK